MHRNKSVNPHNFAMIPRADIPRSVFKMQTAYKTTFDSGFLVPFFLEEALPGDLWNARFTLFARLGTPIVPFMDNLHLETFFFFIPNRLVWDNWTRFMGERPDPDSSIDFTVPEMTFGGEGNPVPDYQGMYDYFGCPMGSIASWDTGYNVSALPFRMYNLVYNEWFRDQNLQDSAVVERGDGPEVYDESVDGNYRLRRRGKRHDYFTSCLPFAQKGPAVTFPIGTSAPVYASGVDSVPTFYPVGFPGSSKPMTNAAADAVNYWPTPSPAGDLNMAWSNPGLYADLSVATAATVNAIRLSFQIQKLLERDARGGTRYTEILFSHFGVRSPDDRLQRPEYLGGGHAPIVVNQVAATAGQFDGEGVPTGNLGGEARGLAQGHGFTRSIVEHGYILGLVNVRADLSYQQGLRRHWSRRTRYDFYFPVFAALGEQAVLNKEIYCDGVQGPGNDDDAVFGYQERWAEYRYLPPQITGLMRSDHAQSLDVWHLSQEFSGRPVLNDAFIQDNPPVERVIATDNMAGTAQFLMDVFVDGRVVRAMPTYSVPGLVDHF